MKELAKKLEQFGWDCKDIICEEFVTLIDDAVIGLNESIEKDARIESLEDALQEIKAELDIARQAFGEEVK